MSPEKVSKVIKIDTLELKMNVLVSEVEIYDNAVQRVNEILAEYKEALPKANRDFQLSMAALDLAIRIEKQKLNHENEMQQLNGLNEKIAGFLDAHENEK